MQSLGTDGIRRELGSDVFVRAALSSVGEGPTVVTDLRFENEARAIRILGGKIVRVRRPGVEVVGTHVSEMEQERIFADHEFLNDGEFSNIDNFLNFASRCLSVEK